MPVPPSKIKTDPMYDDRLVQILKLYCNAHESSVINYRELVLQKKSTFSYHSGGQPRDIDVLYNNYIIDSSISDINDMIIIFDDIITTGAHYKAMHRILSESFPDKDIKGLFLVRTAR